MLQNQSVKLKFNTYLYGCHNVLHIVAGWQLYFWLSVMMTLEKTLCQLQNLEKNVENRQGTQSTHHYQKLQWSLFMCNCSGIQSNLAGWYSYFFFVSTPWTYGPLNYNQFLFLCFLKLFMSHKIKHSGSI